MGIEDLLNDGDSAEWEPSDTEEEAPVATANMEENVAAESTGEIPRIEAEDAGLAHRTTRRRPHPE
ncbi:hypothetical protein DVH05_009009 [Phytophthora capsici]|nr:hypothetical protein DVH05_009009 [Phytophthora capsici]